MNCGENHLEGNLVDYSPDYPADNLENHLDDYPEDNLPENLEDNLDHCLENHSTDCPADCPENHLESNLEDNLEENGESNLPDYSADCPVNHSPYNRENYGENYRPSAGFNSLSAASAITHRCRTRLACRPGGRLPPRLLEYYFLDALLRIALYLKEVDAGSD